mmetsp:Transcript_46797/g.92089  ORF Transcript_46797/g.92089 Transcript_46797/m.92089 type:complete len:671 (+) Transcript_46797:3-2015(+)
MLGLRPYHRQLLRAYGVSRVKFVWAAPCKTPFLPPSLLNPQEVGKPVLVKSRAFSTSGPNSDREATGVSSTVFRMIKSCVWPESNELKLRVVTALTLLVGAKLLNVQVPFCFKYAVDELNIQLTAHTEVLVVPLAALAGYGIARAGASLMQELRGHVFAKVAQAGIRKISRDTFTHLHRLDMSFHLDRDTGALSRAIDRGNRSINFLLNAIVFNIAPTFLELGLVCGILGYNFGLEYVAITTATLATYVVWTISITQWRTRFRKEMNAAENRASSRVFDSLINVETVQHFNNEIFEANRYDQCLREYQQTALKTQSSLSMLNFGQNLIFSAGLAGIMVFASHGIKNGSMTVGDLVMVNGLLFQLSVPLNFVGSVYREVRQAMIDLEVMTQLNGTETKILDTTQALPLRLEQGEGAIAFQNVKFGFSSDRIIFEDMTFEIPAGKSVAVVGMSGSGKSTLLKLLYRFYNVETGSITIDGQNIRDVTLDSLRQAIGIVPQDTSLFNETIYYNIAYGNINASKEEVLEAAKLANIHYAISKMPKGYETVVGERGLKLSGGEKQRIAIARMLLKKPSIVVCDEATSSLDAKTESDILTNLKEVAGGKTTIMIAHRLSTVVDCDRIIVFENGRCVESGTHQQLLQQPKSRYLQMWNQQIQHPAEQNETIHGLRGQQ